VSGFPDDRRDLGVGDEALPALHVPVEDCPDPILLGAQNPGGLSRREVEVLHLAALGLTTRQIADRLYISAKTADHHIQHIYAKIGVSTRAAAALWASQHAVVA
jgi:DNA-binding CsgD family transcriptional regulator